jgi:aminoglycoside phosphotransferase (APT) family kinase protein
MTDRLGRCPEERRFLHGDDGFGNVLARDGEVTAVLDWLDAKDGDFVDDVAWLDF